MNRAIQFMDGNTRSTCYYNHGSASTPITFSPLVRSHSRYWLAPWASETDSSTTKFDFVSDSGARYSGRAEEPALSIVERCKFSMKTNDCSRIYRYQQTQTIQYSASASHGGKLQKHACFRFRSKKKRSETSKVLLRWENSR